MGTSATTTTTTTAQQAQLSNFSNTSIIMDKVKQVVDKVVHPKDHSTTSTTHGTTSTTHGSGLSGSHNAGPHSSSTANRMDPKVDSDMDGSRNMGAANYGPGGHSTTTGMTGTTGYGSSTTHGS